MEFELLDDMPMNPAIIIPSKEKIYPSINRKDSFPNTIRQTASLLMHSSLDLYSLEGESNIGHLQMLVADDGSTLDYIKELVFPDGAHVEKKRHMSAFECPSLINSSADVVVVGANLLLANQYARKGFYVVPKWVRLFLPVEEEPYTRLYNFGRQTRKYFKWMIKKVADVGFECEIKTDMDWLDMFYHDMYLPYARQRFAGSSIVHSYHKVKKTFLRGGGIVAKKDNLPVAGTIISHEGPELGLNQVGVLGGHMGPVRDGAFFAIDYFAVQHAHAQGYKQVNFGHSRPFLSDGPLKYKMNWHMDVKDDDDGVAAFAIAVSKESEQAIKFMQANPFFFYKGDGLRLSDEL